MSYLCICLSCIKLIWQNEKISTLLADVSIEGDIVEKDRIIIDAKINGDIKSEEILQHHPEFKYQRKC